VTNNPEVWDDSSGLLAASTGGAIDVGGATGEGGIATGWSPPGWPAPGAGAGGEAGGTAACEAGGITAGEAGGITAGEAGGITAGGVAAGGTIIAGGEAGVEIWNYNVNDPCHPTGLFTWIGEQIGNAIFGYCNQSEDDVAPCPIPKTRQECKQNRDWKMGKCAEMAPGSIDQIICKAEAAINYSECMRQVVGD